MILNKQNLLNNFWFGENSRERNRQEFGVLPSVFVSPDNSRIWGTDHSGWDGNVNMASVKSNGASFTIIKCMDGTVPSRFWLENRQRAIAAGLIVGDYCWLYPNNKVSARAQAQAVWNLIKDKPKQLPLTVDFEWTRYMGQPANPIYADLEVFVTEFTRLSGYGPMVYSAAGYMNPMGRIPDSLRARISYFWFANYGVIAPTLPFGFSRWDFWQFACTGDATVISPNDAGKLETDLNYWYSNLESLQKAAGLGGATTPPVTPPPTPGDTMELEVKSNESNEVRSIRSGPEITRPKIVDLPVGGVARSRGRAEDIYEYSADVPNSAFTGGFSARSGDKWVRIYSVNGTPVQFVESWLAVRHLGVVYTTLRELGTPATKTPLTVKVTLSGVGYVTKDITETLEPEP